MSVHLSLKTSRRSKLGTNAVNQLRREGRIPAILYGSGEPQPLEVSTRDFIEAIQKSSSENALVDLTIEEEGGKSRLALIQDVQHHPLKDTILHIDFHEIRADQKIQAHVPLVGIGIPDGVKNKGGILDTLLRELHIECLPENLPSEIEVDISILDLEQALHISDLTLPKGVAALHPPDVTIFMIHPPRVAATSETEAAAGDTAAAEKKEPTTT